MRERGTIRRIADETGLDQATVRRALGAAELDADTIPFEQAISAVKAIADSDRTIGHAVNGRGEGGNSPVTDTLAKAKVHSEMLRARKLEIDNAKAEGKLIDREQVTETGARIIGEVRTGLLALGYRIADKIAGKSDVREIARIVEAEVRDVLGVLSDENQFFAALEAEALS